MKSQESLLLDGGNTQDAITDDRKKENSLEQDKNILLLNNLLISVQFFENYDRDIHKLRENWFDEISLESHHKKCFYADSLFRLAEPNVKFLLQNGDHNSSETSLHPLRIYISSGNVEAAYDPSELRHIKQNNWPQYQFTVKTNEKNEKSGVIHLVEYQAMKARSKSPTTRTSSVDFLTTCDKENNEKDLKFIYSQKKLERESLGKNTRRLTATEKLIGFQKKDLNLKLAEKRSSLRWFADTSISPGAFYKYTEPKERMKPKLIHDFRMNREHVTSLEIPPTCFQTQNIKQKIQGKRRSGIIKNGMNHLFRSQNLLNAAAFKGYFCDVLIERLAEALLLDFSAVNMSSVVEEFIIINQSGTQYNISPIITIRDWKNHNLINKRVKEEHKVKELMWPSSSMQKILNILPCHAVPVGHTRFSDENPDYEKEWKLVFPKAEEFLLLHMMHAHVRCYFFALLIYKSFIETKINGTSFGPKHLLHLLFWRVQKDFLAWPENRPGETLLIYLKALYKKLQNKCLRDFFIPSRNLFATSHPKDLHKSQALLKKIIENPVFYVIRAIRNLQLNPDFYPLLDCSKLYTIISQAKRKPEKIKLRKPEKKRKAVHFEDDDTDDEQRWKQNAIRQIELEKRADEKENPSKFSVESNSIAERLDFHLKDNEKWFQILETFFSHFLQMTQKSLEFESSQALFYLTQAQKILDLMAAEGGKLKNIIVLNDKFKEIKRQYFQLNHDSVESTLVEQKCKISTSQTESAWTSNNKSNQMEENKKIKINNTLEGNLQNDEISSAEKYQERLMNTTLKEKHLNWERTTADEYEESKFKFLKNENLIDDNNEFSDESEFYETKL